MVLQLQQGHAGTPSGLNKESYLKAMAFQLFLKTELVLTNSHCTELALSTRVSLGEVRSRDS